MSARPLNRWLLVNYAGYPYAANSLMPDNGLANLAGTLLAAGRQVEILDYATVSMVGRLSSPQLTRRLLATWSMAFPADGSAPGLAAKARAMLNLRISDWQRGQIQTRVLDEVADEVVRRAQDLRADAVGFKLWNGDGILGAAALAASVRRRCPGVRLFGGGPHVDMFKERLLECFPSFDALVFGEGEETILRLAESGGDDHALDHIPNLLLPRMGTVMSTEPRMIERMDDLPLPAYDAATYPAMAGNEKIRILVLDESRGCRNGCAFCIHPVKSHHTQRLKSTARLLAEVNDMRERLGVRTFRFAGSCTPYALLNEFAGGIVRSGQKIAYSSFAHVRESGEADFPLLRRSGCVALFFGIESGSQRVLDLMNKGVKASEIEPAIRRAREAGLAAVGSLIYPAPGDDADTRAETLALMERLRPDGLAVQPAGVVPGTNWFNHPERYGITFPDRYRYRDEAMRWKAKLLLPPALWKSLPVRVDGRTFKQSLRETGNFARDLEARGLTTSVSDDTFLMSACANMRPAEFRDLTRMAFFAGDVDRIRDLVRRINAGV